ncbi:MAG: glycoside hydrolase family 9 protein [Gemmatimonadota bacterium]
MRILTNHVGYEPGRHLRAVLQGRQGETVTGFTAHRAADGEMVASGRAVLTGPVSGWKDWHFWAADFALADEGRYYLECRAGDGVARSQPFLVQAGVLERQTLSNVLFYLKGQRCSGPLDQADRSLPLEDGDGRRVDLHGGWYDAGGDYGKHLSHLSYATYFNPQQITLVAWSLLRSHEALARRGEASFRQLERRLLDEASYGADYLTRTRVAGGSFYRSVSSPGPEKRPEDRLVRAERLGYLVHTDRTRDQLSRGELALMATSNPYQVSFRSGGGMAVAALARAAGLGLAGDYGPQQYLAAAREAFAYLTAHGPSLTSDGRENIIDDYTALLAATELWRATGEEGYREAAAARARALLARLVPAGEGEAYWAADDGDRPFFHPSDAGLPAIALLGYLPLAGPAERAEVLDGVRRSLRHELRLTAEVNNPFGYARQYVQSAAGERRTCFFFPHDTETAPWWQGENARLGSLAAAARLASARGGDDPALGAALEEHAWNQLSWILGRNPYDSCMLHGSGHDHPEYLFFASYEYANAPGGICNGITAGVDDEADVDFNLRAVDTGIDNDWRWTEQWIPHGAWYLLAVSLGSGGQGEESE